jgi:lipopolysaccharide export system permease protein
MAAKNEFIALFSAGISTRRVLMPYLATAILLVGVNFYLTNFLIPDANVTRIKFENKYVYLSNSYNSNSNIHFQYDDSTYFYVSHFDNSNSAGYRFTKEVFTLEDGMSSKLVAESAIYRPDSLNPNKWLLYNTFERKLDSLSERISSKYSDFYEFPISPDDFSVDQINPATLNLFKLNKFIARERAKGSKAVKVYEYEKYQRIAHPVSILILTFLGFIFSIRKKKGAMGYNLAFGLATGFMFIIFLQFSRVFAVANVIPTWLAAWSPILIFTVLSLCFVKNLRR